MRRVHLVISRFVDRRTTYQLELARAIEQQRLDMSLEALWRERVAANVRRRALNSGVPNGT